MAPQARNAADANGIEPSTTNGMHPYMAATRALHADEHLNHYTDVTPAMHVSTTFRYSNKPEELEPVSDADVGSHDWQLARLPLMHGVHRLPAPSRTSTHASPGQIHRGSKRSSRPFCMAAP